MAPAASVEPILGAAGVLHLATSVPRNVCAHVDTVISLHMCTPVQPWGLIFPSHGSVPPGPHCWPHPQYCHRPRQGGCTAPQ